MAHTHIYTPPDCKVSANGLVLTYEFPESRGIVWTEVYCSENTTLSVLVRSKYSLLPDILLYSEQGSRAILPWGLPAISLEDQLWILEVTLERPLPKHEVCVKMLGLDNLFTTLVPHKGRVEYCFVDQEGLAQYVIAKHLGRPGYLKPLNIHDDQIAYSGPASWRSIQILGGCASKEILLTNRKGDEYETPR